MKDSWARETRHLAHQAGVYVHHRLVEVVVRQAVRVGQVAVLQHQQVQQQLVGCRDTLLAILHLEVFTLSRSQCCLELTSA